MKRKTIEAGNFFKKNCIESPQSMVMCFEFWSFRAESVNFKEPNKSLLFYPRENFLKHSKF